MDVTQLAYLFIHSLIRGLSGYISVPLLEILLAVISIVCD